MSSDELQRHGFERRFHIVGSDRDGNRFIFADGVDLIEANKLYQSLLAQGSWSRMLIVIESDLSQQSINPSAETQDGPSISD